MGGAFVSYMGHYVFDVAAAVAVGITQPTVTVTLVPAGTNQCAIPANITLKLLLGPIFTVTTSAAVACPNGQATQVTAAVPPGTTVTWLPGSNLNGTSVLVTPLVTTTYTATATNAAGCIGRRAVTVTVRPPTAPCASPT